MWFEFTAFRFDSLYADKHGVVSSDGKNAFTFRAGLFRLVCENGLVISTQDFADLKIRHFGYDRIMAGLISCRVNGKYHSSRDYLTVYSNLYNKIKGDKLDDKLSKIKFPDFATEEQQQMIENQQEQIEELNKLNKEYSSYELFLKCTHNSGIPFELIKRTLPIINEEIGSLLSNIVEFDAFFENEDGKLEIYIQHPNMDPRPIEMGSGAEKSIAAMAIRLSLLQVSNLPKSNLFILDEPGTALDNENLEGFIRILDMIKNYYDTVLLISHMDALKDVADQIITIDSKDGFAYITI